MYTSIFFLSEYSIKSRIAKGMLQIVLFRTAADNSVEKTLSKVSSNLLVIPFVIILQRNFMSFHFTKPVIRVFFAVIEISAVFIHSESSLSKIQLIISVKQFFKTGQIFKQKSIDNPSFPGDLFSPIHVSASKSYFSRKGFVSLGCQLCEISLSYLFIKSLLFYKVPSNILQLFSPCFVCILPSFLF